MLELRHTAPRELRLGYAGDTYNTAVYLRRELDQHHHSDVQVGYLTGLGDDPYSRQLRRAFTSEGLADQSITLAGRLPGVYAIDTDASGERTFSYWRTASAAAQLFTNRNWIDHVDGDLVHFSGITLQLMSNSTRTLFVARLEHLRRTGTIVSFDTNFRPAGWPTIDAARAAFDLAAGRADVLLVTADDEKGLRYSADPDHVIDRYRAFTDAEIVVKLGAEGVVVDDTETRQRINAVTVSNVVDTTAAGDSFAGGYLAARLTGQPPALAAATGVQLAGRVIQHPGAITPREQATSPR